jgi:WD40 repeat protein/serine/threonine protein kinase
MTQTNRCDSSDVAAGADHDLALLLERVTARLHAGEAVDEHALAAAHPEHVDRLRDLLPSLRLLADASPRGADGQDRPAAPLSPADVLSGEPLGDFRLLREVGRGGMGVVYEAEQRSLGRRVALKVLPFVATLDPKQLQRFHNEAKVAAGLRHEHVVHVYGVGSDRGVHYYAMEFVQGLSLADVIRALQGADVGQPVAMATASYAPKHSPAAESSISQPDARSAESDADRRRAAPAELTAAAAALSTVRTGGSRDRHRRAAALIAEAADALEYAHSMGVVHRDVKPANLLLDAGGKLYVSDFGLARLGADAGVTLSGDLVGTLRYMSPEQARAKHNLVDHRTDVYSLGVTLYELLTLRPAFAGDDPQVLLRQVTETEPLPPRKLVRAIPAELETVALKAIAKEPAHRYQSAGELAEDLRRVLAGRPIRARRVSRAERAWRLCRRNPAVSSLAAAVVVLAVVGFAGVFGQWQVALANEQKANDNAAQAQEKEREAAQQRDDAQKQRDEVRALNEQLQVTQSQLRSTLYAARMNLAQRAWEDAAVPRVRELLDQQRPKPGEPDLRSFEWHYLHRLCQDDQPLFTLRTGPIRPRVSFSPDGKRLISLARGGSVRGPLGWTRYDPEVKVWDAETWRELLAVSIKIDGREQILVLSPDGKRLASYSDVDKTAKVWDSETGKELFTLKGGASNVAFSPDGNCLASRSDGKVTVWDARTGQELLTFNGPGGRLVFSPDGKRLASDNSTGDDNGKIASSEVIMWDVRTGQQLLALKGHTDRIWEFAFSPDGQRLVSASGLKWANGPAGEVKVWDVQTGQELFSLKEQRGSFSVVAFSPDGKHLATDADRSVTPGIKLWDGQTGRLIFTLQGHTSWVRELAFSPDGKSLASSSNDGTLRVWDLQTGAGIRTLKGQTSARRLVFSPDGKRLVTSGNDIEQQGVKVWDVADVRRDQHTLTLKGVQGPGSLPAAATRVVFDPDLKRLAGASGKTVRVWDARTAQVLLTLVGHAQRVQCVAFSPDGTRLASGDSQAENQALGVVKIWDAQTGNELLSLHGHTRGILKVAFSPDGTRLASASNDRVVKVWNALTGLELLSMGTKPPEFATIDLAFSPDGKRLVSGSMVWDAQTGQELPALKGIGSVLNLAFSPDGKRLTNGLKVWDTQTGQEMLSLKSAAGGNYRSVAFSPDGQRLATAGNDRQVTLWDARTGQETFSLKAVTGRVNVLAFSPDGHRLGVVTASGEVTIWDATPVQEQPKP